MYINYGLCGFSDVTVHKIPHSCIFIDPLGGIKEISVPFHFALCSHNGDKARDMHLFKKLKTFLKEEEFDETKLINRITDICIELKTIEVQMHTIETLMNNKNITPDALLSSCKCIIKRLDLVGT